MIIYSFKTSKLSFNLFCFSSPRGLEETISNEQGSEYQYSILENVCYLSLEKVVRVRDFFALMAYFKKK